MVLFEWGLEKTFYVMTVCLMYILLAGTMKENINPSYHKFKPSMNINRFLDFFLTLSDKKGFFLLSDLFSETSTQANI